MIGIAEIVLPIFWQLLPKSVREGFSASLLAVQARTGIQVPSSQVKTYASGQSLRSQFQAELPLSGDATSKQLPKYSLLSTCYNEAESIIAWLDSVRSQTWPPEEVIIVDGGSTDETLQLIDRWNKSRGADESRGIRVQVVSEGRKNISQGRNRSVASAQSEIIAFSDAGTELDRMWAERLLEPFARDANLNVSMGYYKARVETEFSAALERYIVPQISQIDAATFLPSGRSLAMKREVFLQSGGYPEYLSFAGEDSLFDFYLKSQTDHLAFVPEALAFWPLPKSPLRQFTMIRKYSRGDAEGGKLFWMYYLNLIREFGKLGFETLLGFALYSFNGFLQLKFVSILTACVFVGMFVRYMRLILAYRPLERGGLFSKEGLYPFLAVQLMVWAQLIGFLEGLQLRPRVERRQRECARTGHAVLLLHECPTRELAHPTLRRLLEQGYFVTAIYQTAPRNGAVLFEHQFLETYLRSQFHFEMWRKKNEELPATTRIVVDLVNDSLSDSLVLHLGAMGFQPKSIS